MKISLIFSKYVRTNQHYVFTDWYLTLLCSKFSFYFFNHRSNHFPITKTYKSSCISLIFSTKDSKNMRWASLNPVSSSVSYLHILIYFNNNPPCKIIYCISNNRIYTRTKQFSGSKVLVVSGFI